MSNKHAYDAIVVGGGHNGLVNGAYLAKAGLRTLILERRHLVGGAAITEELIPGFHFTTFSYALSLLRPEIIHELELTKHGFMPLLMPTSFAPGWDGEYLVLGEDHPENLREIARLSPRDADAYEQYDHDITRVCHAIKPLLDTIPPNLNAKDPEELARLAGLATYLRDLEPRVLHNAVRLLTGSAADFLDDYFESPLLKGYLASSAIIGTKVGPMSQGSGLVLLYHNLGEHDGAFGTWAFHKGGNGGFTQVLARAAEAFGAEIRLEAPVVSVVAKNGKATGVALEDGTEFDAKIVVSALDPRRTFLELVDPRELPADLVENIGRFRFQGTSAKVNFALDGLPRFPALGDRGDQFRGFTNIGPSMEYLERAFDDAKYGWYSSRPVHRCRRAVDDRSGHGPSRKARHVVLHPVRPVPPAAQRLGHRARWLWRYGSGDARVVLPRVRRPGDPPRDRDPARHRASGRADGGEHLRRRVSRPTDVLLPPRSRVEPVPDPHRGLLPVWVWDPSRWLCDGGSRPSGVAADPRRHGGQDLTAGRARRLSVHRTARRADPRDAMRRSRR